MHACNVFVIFQQACITLKKLSERNKLMATLVFDGGNHTITLNDKDGKEIGSWPANNIVTRAGNHLPYIPNGDHSVATQTSPKRHGPGDDSMNGKYGTYGAVVLNPVKGHSGVAVHSGRALVRDLAGRMGVNYATEGCIRTTDAAMAVITTTMRSDPLSTVTVKNNHDQH
jgi:hypothetical protein